MSEIIPPVAPPKWAYDPVAYRAGLAEGFRLCREAAEGACEDERVDGTVSTEDAAYNCAIDDCQQAIRALRPEGEK